MWRASIVLAGVAVLVLVSGIGINGWVARRSVPGAVYMTLVPVPFQIEVKYSSGRVQGVKIGDVWRKATDHLLSRGCSVLSEGQLLGSNQRRLIDERVIDRNGRVIVRCHGAGVAWNIGLIVRNERIEEVRLAGGIWTD